MAILDERGHDEWLLDVGETLMPGAAARHVHAQAARLKRVGKRVRREWREEADRALSLERGLEEDIQMRAQAAQLYDRHLQQQLEEAVDDLERSRQRRERQATEYAIARRGLKTEIAILDARVEFLSDMSREASERLNGLDLEFGYTGIRVVGGETTEVNEASTSQII